MRIAQKKRGEPEEKKDDGERKKQVRLENMWTGLKRRYKDKKIKEESEKIGEKTV